MPLLRKVQDCNAVSLVGFHGTGSVLQSFRVVNKITATSVHKVSWWRPCTKERNKLLILLYSTKQIHLIF